MKKPLRLALSFFIFTPVSATQSPIPKQRLGTTVVVGGSLKRPTTLKSVQNQDEKKENKSMQGSDTLLQQYDTTPSSIFSLSSLPLDGGSKIHRKSTREVEKLLSKYDKGDSIKDIPVTTYHVSCQSYRPKKMEGDEMLAGIVLYAYNGMLKWELNGVRCRSGYVILKRSEDIEDIKTRHSGKIHGKVYKSVFGVDLESEKVIGSGFSYNNESKKWKFNSWSLNSVICTNSGFHDETKKMHKQERALIMASMRNWIINRGQNTSVHSVTGGDGIVLEGDGKKLIKKEKQGDDTILIKKEEQGCIVL